MSPKPCIFASVTCLAVSWYCRIADNGCCEAVAVFGVAALVLAAIPQSWWHRPRPAHRD
jgi:hypothetical protein